MIGYAHLATALAYLVIGAILLRVSYKVWFSHPVNRVFIFRLLTEEGLVLVLKSWPLVALFGVFITACAIDHTLDFVSNNHNHTWWALEIAAVFEAVVSIITAGLVSWATLKNKLLKRTN